VNLWRVSNDSYFSTKYEPLAQLLHTPHGINQYRRIRDSLIQNGILYPCPAGDSSIGKPESLLPVQTRLKPLQHFHQSAQGGRIKLMPNRDPPATTENHFPIQRPFESSRIRIPVRFDHLYCGCLALLHLRTGCPSSGAAAAYSAPCRDRDKTRCTSIHSLQIQPPTP
jgi:hypothetical protein